MRIVFLGTPEFAVGSLKAMIDAGYNVVAVITAPDKPSGRGLKIHASAVKQYALQHNIPVLQPLKLKDPEFIKELRSYKADLQVVIAFRMLPEIVWSMPTKGTVNLHASLLPDYRGAAPINWAIINGEKQTGVSTFMLKQEIDTGDILFSEKVKISPEMNAGELHDLLMQVGSNVIIKTIEAIENNKISLQPQHNTSSKIAPKLFTQDCILDWNQDSFSIYNKIRGLSPFPGAMSKLGGKVLKIYAADYEIEGVSALKPGETMTDNKNYLKIKTKDGFINIIELQLEGKKRMGIVAFLRGTKFSF